MYFDSCQSSRALKCTISLTKSFECRVSYFVFRICSDPTAKYFNSRAMYFIYFNLSLVLLFPFSSHHSPLLHISGKKIVRRGYRCHFSSWLAQEYVESLSNAQWSFITRDRASSSSCANPFPKVIDLRPSNDNRS